MGHFVVQRMTGAAVTLVVALATLSFGCSSPAPAANSFTEVYTEIIQPTCANEFCHYYGVSLRYSGLDMSSSVNAYWNLVDQLSPSCSSGSGNRRVTPGDPEASLLYLKVQPNPACGAQMPLDVTAFRESATSSDVPGTPLTSAQTALIYNWIKEGAQDN